MGMRYRFSGIPAIGIGRRSVVPAIIIAMLAASACGGAERPEMRAGGLADSLHSMPRAVPDYVNLFLVETDPEPGVAADTGIGCGDRLVPVAVTAPANGLAGAISSLLEQPDTAGLMNVLNLSDDLVLDSVAEDGALSRIYLSGRLMIGGVCDQPRISGQLAATARFASQADSFAFYINGESLAAYLSLRD